MSERSADIKKQPCINSNTYQNACHVIASFICKKLLSGKLLFLTKTYRQIDKRKKVAFSKKKKVYVFNF